MPFFLALFFGSLIFLMSQFREPPGFTWYALFWFFGTIYLIWESGWLISKKLNRRFPVHRFSLKRILLQIGMTSAVGILIFDSTYFILNLYENRMLGLINPFAWIHLVVGTLEAFFIVQIINSFQIGYLLMSNWKQLQIEAEQFRRESMAAKLESIRQQIDPHFLFNNFSTLEGLLHQSPEKASAYLQQLSNLYRIVLDHIDRESVTVREELALFTLYLKLLKMRYEDALIVGINLDEAVQERHIPPFAFQLLLENAIKHNMAMAGKPLKIDIFQEGPDWVCVRNNIQKRSSVVLSKGIGLKNLAARCKFQMGKDIVVKKTRQLFSVSVPLQPHEATSIQIKKG